jgi:hypothetical protein
MFPKRPLIIHYPKPIPFDVLCNYFDKCDIEDKLKKKQLQYTIDSKSTQFKSEKWTFPALEPNKTSITQIMELEEIKRQEEIKQEKIKQEIKRQEEVKQELKRQAEIKKKENRFKSGGWTTVQSKNKW